VVQSINPLRPLESAMPEIIKIKDGDVTVVLLRTGASIQSVLAPGLDGAVEDIVLGDFSGESTCAKVS
jgi:hypothetical protein